MFEVESADLRMLVDVGFIALSAGLVDRAETIFEGVAAARPEAEAGAIGRALVRLARQDFQAAITILRAAEPSDAVQTFLGLAYLRFGMKAEARDCLASVIDSPVPSPHVELARLFLSELEAA